MTKEQGQRREVTDELCELAAKALAENGIGRQWDDFDAIDVNGIDQSDLVDYARAVLEWYESTRALTAVEDALHAIIEVQAKLAGDSYDGIEPAYITKLEHASAAAKLALSTRAPQPHGASAGSDAIAYISEAAAWALRNPQVEQLGGDVHVERTPTAECDVPIYLATPSQPSCVQDDAKPSDAAMVVSDETIKLNAWLSALLRDDCICERMKNDIRAWQSYAQRISAKEPVDVPLPLDRLAAIIAAELARIDGYEPEDENGGLYDLHWSGGPNPEPEGDTWNLEYLPRGERIAKAIATELHRARSRT